MNTISAQKADFTGIKIFVNPGHGGHDSDDRHMIETDFWESEGNLSKGLMLKAMLEELRATVYISRTTNTTADDLPLSSISAMANSMNADFFLAIHSNGYAGTQNQPLMLYRGYDNSPTYPQSKTMADILWQKLYEKGNCWTSSSVWVKGDWTFYPDWGTQGLGVLRGLTMPGVLSEGSFHDYIAESWRLKNNEFLKHEAHAFVRAFSEYWNVQPNPKGIIVGVVRDVLNQPTYYYKAGSKDASLPLNGVKVTLNPGNLVYTVDNFNNGFFFFDNLTPGNYTIEVEGVTNFLKTTVNATVVANKSTLADVDMQFNTALIPKFLGFTSAITDLAALNEEITLTFDLNMNPTTVQNALVFSPQANVNYTWSNKNRILKVKPLTTFVKNTAYTLTLNATATSEWNVPIAASAEFKFTTVDRNNLKLEKSYPSNLQINVGTNPQIRLVFDAPVSLMSASDNILLISPAGATIAKMNEEIYTISGKGYYYFEPKDALSLNTIYKIKISTSLTDETGLKPAIIIENSFTTRKDAYETGVTIEAFDELANFYQPGQSGSTVKTIPDKTLFSISNTRKMSGSGSGQIDYAFAESSGGVIREFDTKKPSIGQNANSKVGIWIFGDLSMNQLEYWFYSEGTINQIVPYGPIDWAGWEFITVPFSSIGGTGNRQFHSIVITQTANGVKEGKIYADNAQIIWPTGIATDYLSTDFVNLHAFPNPFATSSTLQFALPENGSLKVEVFNLFGQKIETLFNGNTTLRIQNFTWTPISVASGMYYYKVEYQSAINKNVKCVKYLKCVYNK